MEWGASECVIVYKQLFSHRLYGSNRIESFNRTHLWLDLKAASLALVMCQEGRKMLSNDSKGKSERKKKPKYNILFGCSYQNLVCRAKVAKVNTCLCI